MQTPAFTAAAPVAGRGAHELRSRSTDSVRPATMSAKSGSSAGSRVAAALAAGVLALSPMARVGELVMPDAPRAPGAAHAARGGGDTFLSASGSVNKDGESILRWSLPISNGPVRELQASLESAIANTRGLKWGKIDGDLRKAKGIVGNKDEKMLASVPADRQAEAREIIAGFGDSLPRLTEVAAERKVEKFVALDREILRDVGRLEELMVGGFPFDIPEEYGSLPQLKGRATVDVVVKRDGGEPFDIDGTLYDEGKMTLVLDGYSAPLSAGSFVDLAAKGFYNGRQIIRSDGFIIQSGKPDSGEGFTLEDGTVREVPLEVFAKGDRSPLYGMTLEDDGRGTAATVLPFSSFGTLAMAREEFEPNTASSQFFWFLFEPDLTPAGRNLMDGSWGVFGYTVNGDKFLRGLQRGDRIVSATVTSGLDNLKNATS